MKADLDYAHANGTPQLRENIEHQCKGAGLLNVLVNVGAIEANYIAAQALVNKRDMYYVIKVASDIVEQCNLMLTSTPSKGPFIKDINFIPGIHITAAGSDTKEKQEIEVSVLRKVNGGVADSIEQCMHRGEIYLTMASGELKKDKVVELGQVIFGASKGRTSEDQLSIADLTEVAVQDIKIVSAVYKALSGS